MQSNKKLLQRNVEDSIPLVEHPEKEKISSSGIYKCYINSLSSTAADFQQLPVIFTDVSQEHGHCIFQAPELALPFSVLLKHLPLTCRLQIYSSSSLEWVYLDSSCHLMLGHQHRILLQTKIHKCYLAHQTCLCFLTESVQRFSIQS